jgi:hypothetical protein
MKHAVFWTLLLVALFSCSSAGDNRIGSDISSQVDSKSDVVDLAKVGPPSWTRVCILGPYSTTQTAESLLGAKWDVEGHSSVGTNEGIQVLVFLKDRDVMAFAEVRRKRGDFVELEGKCLLRSQSQLRRKATAGEWVHLVPK